MIITKKDIQKIKRIERQAYPKHMRQMQYVKNLQELADYCECAKEGVILIAEEEWYLIVAKNKDTYEVVDWASISGANISKIIGFF